MAPTPPAGRGSVRREAAARGAASPAAAGFGEAFRGWLDLGPGVDGRAVLIAAVAIYLAVVAAARLGWGVDIWPALGVPSGPSLFFDARNLTAAWECQRQGYDPLYENPCDPWGRPLMYLRPWLLLTGLGLDQSDTIVLSVVVIALMLVSFCLLLGRVPAGTGLVAALAVCSPAVMFAVERANMDVTLFSVVAAAALLWRVAPGPAAVFSPLLVLLAATAKIYPVFALAAFLVSGRRLAARVAAGCLVVFAAYIVYQRAEVAHVAAIATQGQEFSYGARILPAHLYHQLGADHWAGPAAVKQGLVALPLGLVALALAVVVRRRLGRVAAGPEVASAPKLALHAGAAIYLGTFVMANNFDYRLVFLLLLLPQLVEWIRHPSRRLGTLAAATLIAVMLLLWIGSLSIQLRLWDELASWAVAGLLTALVAATVDGSDTLRTLLPSTAARSPRRSTTASGRGEDSRLHRRQLDDGLAAEALRVPRFSRTRGA